MRQSTSYCCPSTTGPSLGDPLDPGGAVDQRDVGVVERLEVLVVEARPLAEVAVVRLEVLGRGRVGHQLLDPVPVPFHDLVVELLGAAQVLGRRHALCARGVLDGGVVVRPPVVDQVAVDGPAQHDRLEVVHPGALPARLEPSGEVGIGGPVAPLADGRRRALEHVDVLRRLGQRREALDAGRPGAHEADDLVRQAGEGLVRAAAGVLVVPARRVEGAAGEVLHARDGGQLHEVEDPDGQHVPAARISSPRSVRIRHRAASSSHSARVTPVWNRASATRSNRSAIASRWCQDLLAERVAPGGDVVELLEHRQVDVRLDVAHHPRVAVPVPGAPDAAGLVDDADPLDPGLAELGAGEDPGDPPAHDHDVDVVGDRLALGDRGERVVAVVGEVLVGPQVPDLGAAGDQPLVALGEVLGADGLGIVGRRGIGPGHVPTLGARRWWG